MKHFFLLTVVLIMSHLVSAQSNYDILKDPDDGQQIYKGVFTFEDLHAESTFGWLKHGYNSYKPNTTDLNYLKKNLSKYTLVAFIGTWCDDTHKLLPRFEKVLKLSSFPLSQLTLFGVDRDKKAKNVENKLYRIENVPTFIVFSGHKEVGRITESVKNSIEKDLADIIKKDLGETGN